MVKYLEWEPATYSRRAVPRSAARSAPLVAPLGAPSVFFQPVSPRLNRSSRLERPRHSRESPGTTSPNRFNDEGPRAVRTGRIDRRPGPYGQALIAASVAARTPSA
jgi:hypothetical protein